MKLLFKLYENKASRLGILFPFAHTAIQEYENLLRFFESKPCHLKLELRGQFLYAILRNESTGMTKIYRELDYDIAQFTQFQKLYFALKEIQWVHIYYKKNSLLVANAQKKNEFVKIGSLEITATEFLEN